MNLVNARDRALAFLDRLCEQEIQRPIATGIDVLDDLLGGGVRQGLTVLGGMPGIGKTGLVLQVTLRAAKNDTPALYFAADQGPDEVVARLLAAEIARPVTDLLNGDTQAVSEAYEVLERLPLSLVYIEHDPREPGGSVASLDAMAQAVADRHGRAPFVAVDYLQRLDTPGAGSRNDDPRVAIGRSSGALVTLVRERGLTLLAVSSLNRAGYKVEPSIEVFKESGNIEFDADLAMVLRRPVKDDADEKAAAPANGLSVVELWIVKNRVGPLPSEPIRLIFDGRLGSFRSEIGPS